MALARCLARRLSRGGEAQHSATIEKTDAASRLDDSREATGTLQVANRVGNELKNLRRSVVSVSILQV